MSNYLPRILLCFVAMFCGVTAGCGSGGPPSLSDDNETNIQRLANVYGMHQFLKQGAGPEDEASFKTFISGLDISKRTDMGITDTDALFVSERDDQPFTIRYGVQAGARGSVDPVIFEQTGVGGKRMVGFTSLVFKEVDGAEYDQLLGN